MTLIAKLVPKYATAPLCAVLSAADLPARSYYLSADYLTLDAAFSDLLAALPTHRADKVITRMKHAFRPIEDINSRYRVIYLCLRLATILFDGLTPQSSPDHLRDKFTAAVLQGQTMTALWTLTEHIFRTSGIDLPIRPVQSDLYLPLRALPTESLDGHVIICDELIRHNRNLPSTVKRVADYLQPQLSRIDALVAQYIDPQQDVKQRKALTFHINVAQVLASNLRPHSTASCYSDPIQLSRAEYQRLISFCTEDRPTDDALTADSTQTAASAPVHPWDVTDPDTYCGTPVTRLTSLFSGSLLESLSKRLGFDWSALIADARVDWHVLAEDLDHVRLRFAPQVIFNPLSTKSLEDWYTNLTHAPQTWTDDKRRAVADFARMTVSSLVFDTWADYLATIGIHPKRDLRALEIVLGPRFVPHVLHPETTDLHLIQSKGCAFDASLDPPLSHLDPYPSQHLGLPYLRTVEQRVSRILYPIVRPDDTEEKPATSRPPVTIADILFRAQNAYAQDGLHPGRPSIQKLLRADLATFIALASDTWLRLTWVFHLDTASPATRQAEVAPSFSDFEGDAPHLATADSYEPLQTRDGPSDQSA